MSLLAPISSRRPTTGQCASSGAESRGRNQHPDRSVGELVGQSEESSDAAECGPSCELRLSQTCTCGIVTGVKNRWASSGYASLTTIECAYVDGVLVIRGTVSSYYYKQLAQECARGVQGIQQIVNELTVPEWNERRANHQADVESNE